jgi:transposase InsO family protein
MNVNSGVDYSTLLSHLLIEIWRREYNGYRPHSALGYKPPAPEAFEAKNLTQRVAL